MNRFFVQPEDISDGLAVIRGEDVKHIKLVLRMREGDALMLCDSANTEYSGRVRSIGDDQVSVELDDGKPCEAELAYTVTLLQGLPKAGKMETIVQKCVELGITDFIPAAAARSVVKLTAKEFEKKRQRYQKVANESAKQARRGILPRVGELKSFYEIDYSAYDLVLLFYEEEQERSLKMALKELDHAPQSVALVIGPEGGLEKEEVEHIQRQGGVCVSLGKRILRTETAGMAALAMLQYALGE